MSISSSILIAFVLVLSIINGYEISPENSSDPTCPMDFNFLRKMVTESGERPQLTDVRAQCNNVLQAMRLIRSKYLRTIGYFLPPSITTKTCWISYRSLILEFIRGFDIELSCGYDPNWVSLGCMNVTSQPEFEKLIPESKLQEVRLYCDQSLQSTSDCALCTKSLSSLNAYLNESGNGNTSDCAGYPFIYAAAMVNQYGPTNIETVSCLFSLRFSLPKKNNRDKFRIYGVIVGSAIGFLGALVAVFLYWRLHEKRGREEREKEAVSKIDPSDISEIGPISGSRNLVKYQFEEIKIATMNFSTENIIGKGGYGNVYKGRLQDGSEVAVKRFKNCSIARDKSFAHEVEVIASVKHVNLVKLRGYCTTRVPFGGHQRIIVCELMHNGSLYDHIFGPEKLSWPIRHKIALGTARGLAYLHLGAQQGIIHRDIKASNILLDENLEPKVADFGLAKFNLVGVTHLSTNVAGTIGYVAPEYALYGKLTEGSDVYSFGVVLLELLSGKKAVLSMSEGKTFLLADWAWSLVSEGRGFDVIEENMPEMGSKEVMQHYIFVAVLCCHPHLHARPSMDQVVNMLETNVKFPLSLSLPVIVGPTSLFHTTNQSLDEDST